MSSAAHLLVDPSQFPEAVKNALPESLRTRQVRSRLHYETYKQARHWLRIHEAFSPARTDPECSRAYDQAVTAALARFSAGSLHLVGLGTGGGAKEARILELLHQKGLQTFYTPIDSSTPLLLTARQCALPWLRPDTCLPLLADLAEASQLDRSLAAAGPVEAELCPRLVTLFGMLPNFSTAAIARLFSQVLRTGDVLLFSANLAPGEDYLQGIQRVLPLYDNTPTREWLMLLLSDLGLSRNDGTIQFHVEAADEELKQIVARFHFAIPCKVQVEEESFQFSPGDTLQLFHSVRHTPIAVQTMVTRLGLTLQGAWSNPSGEEGVFMATRPVKF